MEIKAIKTRVFRKTEALLPFIFKHVKKIPEKSILVVTSKIVSLSEGRFQKFSSQKEKDRLIEKESDFSIPGAWFTIKDHMVMAAAGVDESNSDGVLTFLPKDSFQSAKLVCLALKRKFKLKNFGVLITDSGFLPMRQGAIGLALGYYGFRGVRNYIGKKDIFGRVLKFSTTNVADSLATAGVVCMGEGNERTPLALLTNPPVIFSKKTNLKELRINPKKDIYAPLFNKIN